jgi:hypothetical protein
MEENLFSTSELYLLSNDYPCLNGSLPLLIKLLRDIQRFNNAVVEMGITDDLSALGKELELHVSTILKEKISLTQTNC